MVEQEPFKLCVARSIRAGLTMSNCLLILFGSGETSSVGKTIHRKVFELLGKRNQRVAVLEIPAGFQSNSEIAANEVAEVFRKSLGEFVSNVSVIPARKKGTDFSPDNPEILEPLRRASYIFLGPGSPTYAKNQLENSLALRMILDRWQNGSALALSSAAALAAGNFTLPVYEIYKVGSDLYWENGLRLTEKIGLNLTIVTHWNNLEGGKDLDTSRCFMGKKRFADLEKLLPAGETILGIGEHTAVIIDPAAGVLTVMGKGSGWVVKDGKENELKNEVVYRLEVLRLGEAEEADVNLQEHFSIRVVDKVRQTGAGEAELGENILKLLEKRKTARSKGLFGEADQIRKKLLDLGYEVRDKKDGQKIYIN